VTGSLKDQRDLQDMEEYRESARATNDAAQANAAARGPFDRIGSRR